MQMTGNRAGVYAAGAGPDVQRDQSRASFVCPVPRMPSPSYAQSLRYQLKDASVQVIELIPSYVQAELMGQPQATGPNAMPFREFTDEVMK